MTGCTFCILTGEQHCNTAVQTHVFTDAVRAVNNEPIKKESREVIYESICEEFVAFSGCIL